MNQNGILDSGGRQTPLALVAEWGRYKLQVVCPYCLSRHGHGIGHPPLGNQTREAHCDRNAADLSSRRYQLCFPFEESARDYSYELDKIGCRFVTVGLVPPIARIEAGNLNGAVAENDEDGDVTELEEEVSQLAVRESRLAVEDGPKKSSNEILDELYNDPNWRLDAFFSGCITNNMGEVSAFLSRYEDPFITSRDSDGDNCIAFAAVEGHLKMIRMLHKNGGNLNNINHKGRTPLMGAALWGRLNVVDFLLANNADARAQDLQQRSALFYALPSTETSTMRQKHRLYREPWEAESNRRIIAVRLRAYEPNTEVQLTAGPGAGRYFLERQRFQHQLTYYENSTAYDIPDEFKTIARLDRGAMFPAISAASGWRDDFSVDHIIGNSTWTTMVKKLCQLIGYELSAHPKDGREPAGTFLASHAEKKVVAFFIDKHMVLPYEMIQKSADQQDDWIKGYETLKELVEVQVLPPVVQRRIYVSKETCADCAEFLFHVERVLGLAFLVETR